jgi:hypothetical protein
MEYIIRNIEKGYELKGIKWGSSLLLKPSDALDFISEVENNNIDIGIPGITLWELLPDGGYMEVMGSFNFDKLPRDKDFVRKSFTESKKFLNELIKDPIYDRVAVDFETEKSRQKRLENIRLCNK